MTASYQDLLEQAIQEHDKDHPVWRYNAKTAGRQLAESLGLRVPQLQQGPCSLADLRQPDQPAVLKPVNGCGSRGVFALMPERRRYRDLLTGHHMNWRQVVTAAKLAKAPRPAAIDHPDGVQHPWIVEELIHDVGDVADDWKCFTFGGRVEVIRQVRRRGPIAVKWWNRDWSELGEVIPGHGRYDPHLPTPRHGDELIAAAETIAPHIAAPFIRIDLYDDEHGPVFGEITPHPFGGTVQFVPEWDRRLGEAWEAAL